MGWPIDRAHAYTVPQTEDWKILKLQLVCAGDLSLIFPLTQIFEIVYSGGRGPRLCEVKSFLFFVLSGDH